MSTHRMGDGTVLNSNKATVTYTECVNHDGHNFISVNTGSQWNHQNLHLSAKGRYWIEHTSQWHGSSPSAELIGHKEAASWLLLNGHELPEDLEKFRQEIEE